MAKIACEVERTEISKDGRTGKGVVVTCGECGHCEESFGQEEKSVKRCLALLRENCPEGAENNFYVDENDT